MRFCYVPYNGSFVDLSKVLVSDHDTRNRSGFWHTSLGLMEEPKGDYFSLLEAKNLHHRTQNPWASNTPHLSLSSYCLTILMLQISLSSSPQYPSWELSGFQSFSLEKWKLWRAPKHSAPAPRKTGVPTDASTETCRGPCCPGCMCWPHMSSSQIACGRC